MAKSYFAILGISPDASRDEVKSAYRRLAKEFNPDRCPGGDEKFCQIQEAYSVLGDSGRSGTYLLRIGIVRALDLAFGRFMGGKPVHLPAGEYAYVGSALGQGLAARLIRHATRTGGKPPHRLRGPMIAHFGAIGLGGRLPSRGKRLHWHVDYLLDHPAAELTCVIAVRSSTRLEPVLAARLENDPCTTIVAPGLGANDAPGHTHLLRVCACEAWWAAWPETFLQSLLGRK